MKRPRKIRARRMWENEFLDGECREEKYAHFIKPVAVLDISDPEALVEQVGNVIYGCDEDVYGSTETARAVLESLNIIPKRKGARNG